jgi:hypothetical protein
MVAINPNGMVLHAPVQRVKRVAVVRDQRRWSARRTVVFAAVVSIAGWVAIGYGVMALFRH